MTPDYIQKLVIQPDDPSMYRKKGATTENAQHYFEQLRGCKSIDPIDKEGEEK